MRRENKLTPLAVKNATKPGLYGDGLGLYLQVSAFGTKSWIFRWMRNGRPRKAGLGATHTVSLAEARKRAAAARLQVHDGEDPIEVRHAARSTARLEAAKTISFKECADAYIKANEASWRNAKHVAQWRSTFTETARGKRKFPAATAAINELPVAAVDTGLVLKVLEPIWGEKPETASRVRGRIESVLDWATVRQYRTGDNPARWRGHLENALGRRSAAKKTKHHDAIPYAELPAFMDRLRARDGLSARALELTILTAVRTSEAIGAEWREIDLDAKVWTIPGSRMKAGKDHRIPLSDRAVELLRPLGGTDRVHVFPGARAGRTLSDMAMLELVRGMRGKGATVHGFRSTFRDWAAELTAYPNHVVEAALAHTISDKVEAAYRRGDLFEKRRRLMDDWAAYCEMAANDGAGIVPLRAVS